MCHPIVEQLSILDDSFDTLDVVPTPTREQLVSKTLVAAKNLRDKADEICFQAQGGETEQTDA